MDRDTFLNLTAGAYQNPEEIRWVFDQHLQPIKPKRILEIGLGAGGTTRLFLHLVGADGDVVGIDPDMSLVAEDVKNNPRFTALEVSSLEDDTARAVADLGLTFDVLFIDGLHTEEAVRRDSELYIPFVRPGGLVLWHDVQLESLMGVRSAWYGGLREDYWNASQYYADANQSAGFGYWYKTDVTAKTVLVEANQLLADGKTSEALERYRQVNQQLPANQEALLGLAACLRIMDDKAGAGAAALTACLLNPSLAASTPDLPEDSARFFGELTDEKAASPETLFWQGRQLAERGLHKEAIASLRRARALKPEDARLALDLAKAVIAYPASSTAEQAETLQQTLITCLEALPPPHAVYEHLFQMAAIVLVRCNAWAKPELGAGFVQRFRETYNRSLG